MHYASGDRFFDHTLFYIVTQLAGEPGGVTSPFGHLAIRPFIRRNPPKLATADSTFRFHGELSPTTWNESSLAGV